MKINIRGYEVLIDNEDYEKVMAHNWLPNKRVRGAYFRYFIKRENGKQIYSSLHRYLINAPNGSIVDHINGDILDNRKSNLRITDALGNSRNHGMNKTNTSGYRGVVYSKSLNRWRAIISMRPKPIHLGYYPSKEIAAYVYEEATKVIFGEYYRDLNISPEIVIPTWHIKPCKAHKNSRGWYTTIYCGFKNAKYLTGYATETELQEAYKKLRAETDIKILLEKISKKIKALMGDNIEPHNINDLATQLKTEEKREPIQITCKNCGKVFFSSKVFTVFCCRSCSRDWHYRECARKHKHTCEFCGKEFEGAKRSRYCTISCATRATNKSKTKGAI